MGALPVKLGADIGIALPRGSPPGLDVNLLPAGLAPAGGA